MSWTDIIGNIIIGIGVLFMILGAVGTFKFNNFYARMMVASKVDTVGIMTMVLGMSIRHGFTFFTAKMWLIVVIILILNPLVTHVVAKSAYESGHPMGGKVYKAKDRNKTK